MTWLILKDSLFRLFQRNSCKKFFILDMNTDAMLRKNKVLPSENMEVVMQTNTADSLYIYCLIGIVIMQLTLNSNWRKFIPFQW